MFGCVDPSIPLQTAGRFKLNNYRKIYYDQDLTKCKLEHNPTTVVQSITPPLDASDISEPPWGLRALHVMSRVHVSRT